MVKRGTKNERPLLYGLFFVLTVTIVSNIFRLIDRLSVSIVMESLLLENLNCKSEMKEHEISKVERWRNNQKR